MVTVVVTGGIGSGKSTVCRYLGSEGIPVYDADSRTKALYDRDSDLTSGICEALGTDVRNDSGLVDRRKLAAIVFSDRSKLKALEAVVHPRVLDDFLRWRGALSGESLVVLESAIYFQVTAFHPYVDCVILVDAPAEERLRRASARDGSDPKEIESRMSSQSFDWAAADYIINNDSDIDVLRDRTRQVLEAIRNQFESK